jgi:hypothetical protein
MLQDREIAWGQEAEFKRADISEISECGGDQFIVGSEGRVLWLMLATVQFVSSMSALNNRTNERLIKEETLDGCGCRRSREQCLTAGNDFRWSGV